MHISSQKSPTFHLRQIRNKQKYPFLFLYHLCPRAQSDPDPPIMNYCHIPSLPTDYYFKPFLYAASRRAFTSYITFPPLKNSQHASAVKWTPFNPSSLLCPLQTLLMHSSAVVKQISPPSPKHGHLHICSDTLRCLPHYTHVHTQAITHGQVCSSRKNGK